MSSLKSSSSMGDPNGKDSTNHVEGAILKMGYIKKLKTMKKKFFIIRGDSTDSSASTARIEYYDSEKKWRSHHSPKRCILLKSCFNINRRVDTKHKNVIALYTKDDCFCLVFDSEEEMSDWLKALLSLQQGDDSADGESPKPTFEHVWQVTVAKRGLGSLRNLLGPHLLCLTDKTLSLVKINQNEKTETYEFSLMNIRRCGDMESFFYMEVGRLACTGAGDLWMLTEDPNIAQNMHAAILHAMSNNSAKEELGPRPRNRSSSANEASKPISVLQRRQTHAGLKPGTTYFPTAGLLPPVLSAMAGLVTEDVKSSGGTYNDQPVAPQPATQQAQASHGGSSGHVYHHYPRHPPVPVQARPSQRRHSVSAMSVSTSTCASGAPTPACASVGGAPTHQRTHSLPLSDPSALPPWETRRGSTGRVGGKRSTRSTTGASNGRERCDSMPSRARTTSEGHHAPPQHGSRCAHLVPGHNRPHSMYNRGSPPIGSNPVSPASGACSTDSAGSSLSVDDEHNWMEMETGPFARCGLSLTPDEPSIMEENLEGDSGTEEKLNNYMPMDRAGGGLLSLQIQKPTTAMPIRFSPNLSGGFKAGSPSASHHAEMGSPGGSSPLDIVGAYMPMSPGPDLMTRYGRSASSASHSRASSLADEGYVPMAPGHTDDGYVDMDPAHPDLLVHGEMSPGNSSCSIASGTPSTDLRFSEYPLEKVTSYFTPSEEEEGSERPGRAYSVGSRPHSTPKTRPDLAHLTETIARQRAFSVGSRAAKPGLGSWSRHVLAAPPPSGGIKSSSAPLLSHSWSGSPTLRPPLFASGEPMDDLMEMDFSKNNVKAAKNRSNAARSSLPPPTQAAAPDIRLSVPLAGLSISPSGAGAEVLRRAGSDYVEMSAGEALPPASNPTSVAGIAGPYMEMKPGSGGDILSRSHSVSPPQMNHVGRGILSSSPQSAASPPSARLLPAARKTSVLGPSSPYVDGAGHLHPAEPTLVTRNTEAYMDMRGPQPQHFPTTTHAAHPPARTSAELHPLARKLTSPIQEEYMEMNMPNICKNSTRPAWNQVSPAYRSDPVDTPQPRGTTDPTSAYVDMTWGAKPSGGGGENYMNVMAGAGSRKQKERRKDKKRYSSQPIAIQTKDTKPGSSASTSPVLSRAMLMAIRKPSTGTPPKIPPDSLPVDNLCGNTSPGGSPFNSLKKSRHRKASRRGSSETNLTTPTGSTTGIFPFSLNSPGSPMKPLPGAAKTQNSGFEYDRKCPVDASSGTVCISYPYPEGSSGSTPVTPDSSSSSEQPTPVNTAGSLSDIPGKAEESSDYVNYSPARKPNLEQSAGGDEFGEYALMLRGGPQLRGPGAPPPSSFAWRIKADNLQNHFNASQNQAKQTSSPTVVSSKRCSIVPPLVEASAFKPTTISSLLSFRPITSNPNAGDGSASPKIISSFSSANKSSLFFNRQHSSTSASSAESVKSQEAGGTVAGAGKGAGKAGGALVSRQLSNSSVKSASECSVRDDGAYESLSGGVSPVPASRPGSVSCERELHYASLDLVTEPDDATRSPRNFKNQNSLTESTASPNLGQGETFTYAEIDFVKSESLKNSVPPPSANTKVCH